MILPFHSNDAVQDNSTPGYISLPLEPHGSSTNQDRWRYGRSEDQKYLSKQSVCSTVHRLIERAISLPMSITDAVQLASLGLGDPKSPYIKMSINAEIIVNIIPAIKCISDDKVLALATPRDLDLCQDPDRLWRLSHVIKEGPIMDKIDRADGDMRRSAAKNLLYLKYQDGRLSRLQFDHIKTAVYSTVDMDVDTLEQWQKHDINH